MFTARSSSLRKRLLTLGLCLAAAASAAALWPARPSRASQQSVADAAKYEPVTEFDPRRDAASDIALAIIEAKRTGRRVLLDVGGKWCIWCRIMDDYFETHADLLKLRDENFVTVKVNFSPENENKEVLSKYPEIPGYPHLFVLDSEGKLIQSQGTGELEEGKSYNKEKFVGFLRKWSPSK
jgi:thiol:disulfide interchange protein